MDSENAQLLKAIAALQSKKAACEALEAKQLPCPMPECAEKCAQLDSQIASLQERIERNKLAAAYLSEHAEDIAAIQALLFPVQLNTHQLAYEVSADQYARCGQLCDTVDLSKAERQMAVKMVLKVNE